MVAKTEDFQTSLVRILLEISGGTISRFLMAFVIFNFTSLGLYTCCSALSTLKGVVRILNYGCFPAPISIKPNSFSGFTSKKQHPIALMFCMI
jgi:hypothetical protein